MNSLNQHTIENNLNLFVIKMYSMNCSIILHMLNFHVNRFVTRPLNENLEVRI